MTVADDHSKEWKTRPARSQPFAPFEDEQRAMNFADYLDREVNVKAEVVWISGSSGSYGQTMFWDLKVPYHDIFKVKLLYRLRGKYRFRDLPKLRDEEKIAILRDQLHGDAHMKGGWREPMCSYSDQQWYAEVSGLSMEAVKAAVAAGKEAYYKQHQTERHQAFIYAGIMLLIGLISFCFRSWVLMDIFGVFFTGSGVAFLIFALTRKQRGKKRRRSRLPG